MLTSYQRKLLRDSNFRRFAVESLLVMLVAVAVFQLLIAPELRSLFPELFPRSIEKGTGREPPETRLGWFQLTALVGIYVPFFYYRLRHTDLGAAVRAVGPDGTERLN
ncbi:hypothetical protein ACFQDG_06975 [Natronoarchaeum mannanilyticum]|uniref:Uncharacterized protein n=1 Tax=Natronoarchaeum mannanilyticum TaxID=926360 RepID=A0AAV3T7Q1_9EURY